MALELGVARKTIQNWEKGTTVPSLEQTIRWFQTINVSPLPYLLQYIFPDLEGLSSKDDETKLRNALKTLVDNLPEEEIRQLLFLMFGDHGSSSRAVLNLITAHLQTPMKDRVTQASVIIRNYDIAQKKGQLSSPNHIKPNMELMLNALHMGEEAVLNNKNVYVVCNPKSDIADLF